MSFREYRLFLFDADDTLFDFSASEIDFSDLEVKERMSGNLCRCGAYVGITEAIRETFASEVRR